MRDERFANSELIVTHAIRNTIEIITSTTAASVGTKDDQNCQHLENDKKDIRITTNVRLRALVRVHIEGGDIFYLLTETKARWAVVPKNGSTAIARYGYQANAKKDSVAREEGETVRVLAEAWLRGSLWHAKSGCDVPTSGATWSRSPQSAHTDFDNPLV